MARRAFTIAGYGELIFDHILIRERQDKTRYIYSRGGGPVWNVLCQFACFGRKTQAIGVGGDDLFGRASVDEMASFGVDVKRVNLIAGKHTRVIFETLYQEGKSGWPRHSFSEQCQICKRSLEQRMKPNARGTRAQKAINWDGIDLIYFDRLVKDRVELAEVANKYGVFSVLDLGRMSDLRFKPAAQIAHDISRFDIVQMPSSIARSIERRTGIGSIARLIQSVGRVSLICVTSGRKGMQIFVRTSAQSLAESYNIDGMFHSKLKDEAGAGDCFMANLLERMRRAGLFENYSGIKRGDSLLVKQSAISAARAVGRCVREIGARGHLPSRDLDYVRQAMEKFRGKLLSQIQVGLGETDFCPFYQLSISLLVDGNKPSENCRPNRNTNITRAGRNVGGLVKKTFFTIEKSDAIKKAKHLIADVRTVYVTGTGGSFSAATFISLLLNTEDNVFAQPIRPYDYIRTSAPSDLLLAVTHSGSTPDCESAIMFAKKNGVRRIGIITARQNPKLARLLRQEDEVISYGWGRPERGFLSIAGTVCPCALWAAIHSHPEDIIALSQRLDVVGKEVDQAVDLLKGTDLERLEVFGGGMAWPAMVDLESKFVEGRIGIVQLHESKDFSHGRFISGLDKTSKQRVKLMMHVGQLDDYERTLLDVLKNQGDVAILHSDSNKGSMGSLEVLIKVQFLFQRLARAKGLGDISKQRPPAEGLRLYHKRLSLRRGM